MKFFVCVLALGLLYAANSLPINEQSTGANGSAATVPVDPKTESKSEIPSTPITEQKLTESVTKESSSPAPSSTLSNEERSSSPKEELIPQLPQQHHQQQQQQQPLKPSVPSPVVPVEESANKASVADIPKSETGTKSAPLTSQPAEKPEQKVEHVSSSSEQPKELNNQVNAVSVDEPRPVQNEVKSEIPKDTTKSEVTSPKDEVKAEKVTEKKEEKRDESKAAPVLNGAEAKPAEKLTSVEELKKPAAPTSSEEKSDSHERDASRETTEKKETVKSDQSSASSEEKKPAEKPVEDIKKEVSSVKPQAEPLPTEPSKPSTLTASAPHPAVEKVPEKSESEKDVIKREAAGKDKHEEKKSTENSTKKDKIKYSPSKEISSNEDKNTKPQ